MSSNSILLAENLSKSFQYGLIARLSGKNEKIALNNVSIKIQKDEILAIVGESGSGKTTLSRILLNLLPPSSGTLTYHDIFYSKLRTETLKNFRRDVQAIFQDPSASLNPRHTVQQILNYIISKHQCLSRHETRALLIDTLNSVGFEDPIAYLERYPHQLSGGQQQRISIARALLSKPRVIIADEPLAALDAAIQKQVLELLMRRRKAEGITLVLITHDLRLSKKIADRLIVMNRGQVVEQGNAKDIFKNPQQKYTQKLLESSLNIDPNHSRFLRRSIISGT